jgi:hypothetical protein
VPVADLGLDPRQLVQPCDAVWTTRLALIQQVIVQFAVAIHLAAVLPGFIDEFGLASIFPGPFAHRVLEPSVEAARMDA